MIVQIDKVKLVLCEVDLNGFRNSIVQMKDNSGTGYLRMIRKLFIGRTDVKGGNIPSFEHETAAGMVESQRNRAALSLRVTYSRSVAQDILSVNMSPCQKRQTLACRKLIFRVYVELLTAVGDRAQPGIRNFF